jgi:cell fate (sporulation/competence/biofilm development) regulator YmcA (YheA/YmcA/DUF963 family)
MDPQALINIAFGLAGFFGGWVINSISKSIIRIEDRISELPLLYVTKDDYKRDIDEIKAMLVRIFDRLDDKVDK